MAPHLLTRVRRALQLARRMGGRGRGRKLKSIAKLAGSGIGRAQGRGFHLVLLVHHWVCRKGTSRADQGATTADRREPRARKSLSRTSRRSAVGEEWTARRSFLPRACRLVR